MTSLGESNHLNVERAKLSEINGITVKYLPD